MNVVEKLESLITEGFDPENNNVSIERKEPAGFILRKDGKAMSLLIEEKGICFCIKGNCSKPLPVSDETVGLFLNYAQNEQHRKAVEDFKNF